MKHLGQLRKSAQESAEFRGHSIRWYAPHHGERASTQIGECRWCGLEAYICTNPMPNGIDIGGEAVALNCGGDKEVHISLEPGGVE